MFIDQLPIHQARKGCDYSSPMQQKCIVLCQQLVYLLCLEFGAFTQVSSLSVPYALGDAGVGALCRISSSSALVLIISFIQSICHSCSNFISCIKCVGLLLLQPIRSPLAPDVLITGIVPSESSIFKSALHPLRLTFRTANGGSWKIIFKKGDDLRQDQLVAINIFPLFVTHTHIT